MAKLEDLIARDTRSNQPTAGVAGRLYFVDDENVLERDTGSAWEPFMAADQSICNGRLTLESGVPISTTDQTAKTTVYFTPFRGNKIALYDGSGSWSVLKFAEISLSLSGYTADKNYDIWAYNNSGAVALDSTIWTNDTTRATALALQDGIYVKTGATTRRYLGTIRITGTTGQCEDSLLKRFIWNYYNRVRKYMYFTSSDSHTYNTNSFRYWNNSSSSRMDFVIGIIEDSINVDLKIINAQATSGGSAPRIAITWNGATSLNTNLPFSYMSSSIIIYFSQISHTLPPSVGYTYASVMETNLGGAGVATFSGVGAQIGLEA